MRLGPFTLTRTKAAASQLQQALELQEKQLRLRPLSGTGSWWPWPYLIRESYTGAWQRNDTIAADTVLSFSAVFACTTLIMGDVGKTNLRLVERDADGIWNEIENPAYSPVLRKPNRYQTISQFKETWTASKLNNGNAYVLKQRDNRGGVGAGNVVAMYVLDPTRVTPLVADDGAIYYELKRDHISNLPKEVVTVPASEIIHDRMNCLFHPLVGLSPIYACSLAATQGLAIQNNSSSIFSNGSSPGGVLTTPKSISDETAARVANFWNTNFTGNNAGKVAFLGDDVKYQPIAWNPVDMQLVEQLKLSAETVCTAYHVPPYLVDIGEPPPYANVEPVIQKYYSQCLQVLFIAMECVLDEGLGLGKQFGNNYGTEFDPDDLIWMDAPAKSKAAQDGIGSGGMAPNEARKRFYGLPPTAGGETPYMQEQNWPLRLLSERQLPTRAPTAPAELPGIAAAADDATERRRMRAATAAALNLKAIKEGLYAT